MAITYNASLTNITYIYRATNGGTVFSANEAANTTFDYFANNAVANDAIYFGNNNYSQLSDLTLNIGTPMAGSNIVLVWEYYCVLTGTWRTMHNITDQSNKFTVTGAVRIVFPIQAGMSFVTVNGIASITWVRCRIVSLTSITEGGANTTSRVQKGNGVLYIDGYTDGSPCSWTMVYDWIIANAPQIGATKISSDAFKFDNVMITINSRLRSINERVYIGNGCYSANFNLSYLHSGSKVGSNGWSYGSDYYLCYRALSQILTMSNETNTKIYGGVWRTFNNIVDGIVCTPTGTYLGISSGEWIGVYAEQSGYFSVAYCDRCIVGGDLITASKPIRYPTNLQIADAKNNIWRMYGNSLDVSDIVYSLPATTLFSMGPQYGDQNNIINIINPNPAFPEQTSTPRVASRTLGSTIDFTGCKFYDASAGTYTDYLTQAADVTADDVPVNGDVGDCLYFTSTSIISREYNPALTFTINNQSNDYEYVWEFYRGTTWHLVESDEVWDLTDNFTKSGYVYLGMDGDKSTVTIDGLPGYWFRLRIVTKGTGSPVVSRIQLRAQLGITKMPINELYTANIKVADKNGTPIQNATVKVTDVTGTLITLMTDANGNAPATNLITSQTKFDKDAPETDFNYKKTSFNPYVIVTDANGYATDIQTLTIGPTMRNIVITLDQKVGYAYVT